MKIADTKSSSKKINALHYIIEHLEKHDSSVLGFALELNAVLPASKVELSSLAAEVKSLSDMVGRVKFALDKVPSGLDPEKDKLSEVINATSVAQYQNLLNAIRTEVASLHVEWATTARSYGEDEKQIQSTEFFAMIVQFIHQFEEARKVSCFLSSLCLFVLFDIPLCCKALHAMRLAKQQKAAQKAAQQLAANRDKAEADRAKKFSTPNAQLSLLQAATNSEDVTAAALGAKEAALLLEVTQKLAQQGGKRPTAVPQQHMPPTSAMLANLRNGLKSGAAFAEKRDERKRSMRGKIPDDVLPKWVKPPSDNSSRKVIERKFLKGF